MDDALEEQGRYDMKIYASAFRTKCQVTNSHLRGETEPEPERTTVTQLDNGAVIVPLILGSATGLGRIFPSSSVLSAQLHKGGHATWEPGARQQTGESVPMH